MLSLKSWSISELVDETHKEVGFDVWPIGLQDGEDVVIGWLIVAILQVHGPHYQVEVLSEDSFLDVIFFEEFSFFFHIVFEAKLGISEPHLWVINRIGWRLLHLINESILQIPFGMLTISSKVILLLKS